MRYSQLVLLGLLDVGSVFADGWVVVEAPAAIVTSDAQRGVFRAGPVPAVGVYSENERFAVGLRIRGGVLRDGNLTADNLGEPGTGGLLTAAVATRLAFRGAWFEVAGGGGITGRDLVPTVEVGIGWMFALDKVDVGVTARHVRLVSRDPMDAFGTAQLAVFGVDVRFGRQRPRRVPRTVAVESAVTVAPDLDRIVEREATCMRDATCPHSTTEVITEDVVVRDDRIVLDDHVLFALDRARIRSRGRDVLRQVVRAWRERPEWQHITIEGHADVRGSDDYNQTLSERRANQVRDFLILLGCSGDAISARGLGRTRPRDAGREERAHERNRRVEFVIDRKGTP